MRQKRISGFTLVEMLLVTGLLGVLLLLIALWFRSGTFALKSSISEHELHMEAAASADLLNHLLSGADPLSYQLSSTPDGPWSELSFAAGPHHYTFSASNHQLVYTTDHSAPRTLSAHLIGLHFAFDRNQLPTLLRWSIRLSAGPQAREVYFSGVQYVGRPAE